MSGSPSSVAVTQITTEEAFSNAVAAYPPSALLVIYFHAPWAAPCKQMSAVLEALASTYTSQSPPNIAFLSIDAEELPDTSEKYDVTAVPYIVLQKDGKVLEKISGSNAEKVRAAVEKYAGKGSETGKFDLPPAQAVTKPAQEPTVTENGTIEAKEASNTEQPSGEPSKEELFKRLEGLVKAAPVMLFMKGSPSAPQCGFSRRTVALLRERSIRYGFFNILADDDVRQGLKEYADWPTYPQLWVDGELVGGIDIVQEEFQNNPDFLSEYSVHKISAAQQS
ncbi:glutaredoxin [Trichodelitschia bisporula]|uniref:Glutaredoxin n=1 Tax=Trichodelitschia bisporula TaxID=703511 RepID=A0A6G1HP00_9PEZI|nr:glutaredoxin [Trichodelitschia bisporula]